MLSSAKKIGFFNFLYPQHPLKKERKLVTQHLTFCEDDIICPIYPSSMVFFCEERDARSFALTDRKNSERELLPKILGYIGHTIHRLSSIDSIEKRLFIGGIKLCFGLKDLQFCRDLHVYVYPRGKTLKTIYFYVVHIDYCSAFPGHSDSFT
jgi:hypothetical protein